jgi:hypothetical protein
VNADWAAWQAVKSADLERLNQRLTAAGLQPIAVPAGAALRVKAAEGGADLP